MRFLLGGMLYAFDYADIQMSRIDFSCDKSIAESAKECFEESFKKAWDETEKSKFSSEDEWEKYRAEQRDMYYDSQNKYEKAKYPINAYCTQDGFSVVIDHLGMDTSDEVTYELENEPDTLIDAIKQVQNEYPTIQFDGYIGYTIVDEHGSDLFEFSVSSILGTEYSFKPGRLFPSVGEGLSKAVENDKFWEELFDIDIIEDNEDDEDDDWKDMYRINIANVLKLLFNYSAWLPEDICEKYIDLVEEHGVGAREKLEKILLELQN